MAQAQPAEIPTIGRIRTLAIDVGGTHLKASVVDETGNLLAERTGKAVLHGLVTKAAKSVSGDLEIYGMVQGDVINEGGRLFVDKGAVVRGKVIGQTHQGPIPPPEKVAAAPGPAATVPPTTPATTPAPGPAKSPAPPSP